MTLEELIGATEARGGVDALSWCVDRSYVRRAFARRAWSFEQEVAALSWLCTCALEQAGRREAAEA